MALKIKGKIAKELERKRFRVAIFGSARLKKDSSRYKEVYKLAKMLAERDIDVVTGGGPGLMNAANSGLQDGRKSEGTRSIGLNIKLLRKQKSNKHLDVKKEFSRFTERLDNFMVLSNIVVVAPGGVGTLLELFYSWQLAQVEHICNMPIILMGKMWPDFIKWLEKWPLKRKFFDKQDINLLFLAKDADETIKMIDTAYREYKKGNKTFCLNYKKYKLY